MHERTHVGLDVHALSVVACAIDGQTGEILRGRLTPDHGETLAWIEGLPGPCRVVYEAGPTGFVLARFLRTAGVDCVVAAPSKLQRPPGDRVKTNDPDHPTTSHGPHQTNSPRATQPGTTSPAP